MKWQVGIGVVVVSASVGFVVGRWSSRDKVIAVQPPVLRITDTVQVPPKWMMDLVKSQDAALAKKPRRDTMFLAQQVLVKDSFPYPISVPDTSVHFWYPERATFGQKPNSVTDVVTRDPKSGEATVLRYATPGPILSFVADTSPRPRITFGEFVEPKKHHGILTDIGLVLGGTTAGFVTGSLVGCVGGQR